jgi:hypothetical protein
MIRARNHFLMMKKEVDKYLYKIQLRALYNKIQFSLMDITTTQKIKISTPNVAKSNRTPSLCKILVLTHSYLMAFPNSLTTQCNWSLHGATSIVAILARFRLLVEESTKLAALRRQYSLKSSKCCALEFQTIINRLSLTLFAKR